MPLPKSLVQPYRQNQLFVGSGWRAFWAPFNTPLAVEQSSTSVGPTIYDLEVLNSFTETTPPAGWFDLGLIDKFKYTPGSKIGSVQTGYRMATRSRYRGNVGEKCSFTFRESSHLGLKIATGAQVFNLLKSTATASLVGPLSSSGTAAFACGASGYVVAGAVAGYVGQPVLYVPAGSGTKFAPGSFLVCDQDYAAQTGWVGDAGAWVFPGTGLTDVDYIRKTSDYVATVAVVRRSRFAIAGRFDSDKAICGRWLQSESGRDGVYGARTESGIPKCQGSVDIGVRDTERRHLHQRMECLFREGNGGRFTVACVLPASVAGRVSGFGRVGHRRHYIRTDTGAHGVTGSSGFR